VLLFGCQAFHLTIGFLLSLHGDLLVGLEFLIRSGSDLRGQEFDHTF
jgi:hypothetical protein